MTIFPTVAAFEAALRDLPHSDPDARENARSRQAELTKPAGSLGRLEDLAIHIAAWQRTQRPSLDHVRTVIFAGNHGVAAHGVSAFPPSVTAQMVANFEAGGAAINALCGVAGSELKVVPIALDQPTADFTQRPAMTALECLEALEIGAAAVDPDLHLLTVGEMGIGNTTAAAAICAHLYGGEMRGWTGPGTGLDQAGLTRKSRVINAALARHAEAPRTAFETLRRLGGRELVAIAGAVLRARMLSIPVLMDGFITCAAIAPLAFENAALTAHCIAAHQSAEPGHQRLLAKLNLDPLLRLEMRLGEGSGAAVAVNLIRSALAMHNQMATFAEAQVAGQM